MNWNKFAADEASRNQLIDAFRNRQLTLDQFYRKMKQLESESIAVEPSTGVDIMVITWDLSTRENGRFRSSKENRKVSIQQLVEMLNAKGFRKETGILSSWKSPVLNADGKKEQQRIVLLSRGMDPEAVPRLQSEIESLR